ncbi:MAG: TIM barrel protein [archaeon]|jgi:deoxyribonuclease-4|nr:TIM barrel protein [archaeon]MDD2477382.1 TIM barrel protein [Candidatus ainarchaeum sp.]MDD3084505.1 TIM barrel protein [Candidatus ainarchaeum sp.]MDD4220786.1 TIM barrel protein [Candidatus ainarchaeum sp.]MDD4662285.1 TIM barrel protein [Candidatus ainarchaeum sp.]
MSFEKLHFGPAGFGAGNLNILNNSKNPTADAILEISKLGLSALEIEFVRGVYLKKSIPERLEEIKNNSDKSKVNLSVHAPYFINLNAVEKHKINNSQRYILDSLNVGQKIGARVIVCHIGYFLKQEPKKVLENISRQIEIIQDKYEGDVKLGIELTGKKTQVGSLSEIFYFLDKFPKFVHPVIDFAHQHARENGYFNNPKNIDSFFEELNTHPKIFNDIHIHMSGINYSEKGEKNHLIFKDADFPYKRILEKLKDNKAKGTVICESPNIIGDALLLKKTYEKL